MSNLKSMSPVARAAVRSTATPQGRAIPSATQPSPSQTEGNYNTRTFVALTTDGLPTQLYSSLLPWTRVRLKLETAGPVEVSTNQSFLPLGSGKGIPLQNGVWTDIVLARGNALWIAATAINRVSVIIEPIPWGEQILGGVVDGFAQLAKVAVSLFQAYMQNRVPSPTQSRDGKVR